MVRDGELQNHIEQCRSVAQSMGEKALFAVTAGDIGLARSTARQAAQYAHLVMQLETGEWHVEPGAALHPPVALSDSTLAT